MKNFTLSIIVFLCSFLLAKGQHTKIYQLIDYVDKSSTICDNQTLEALKPFLKSKDSQFEMRIVDATSTTNEVVYNCSKVKNSIFKYNDKNICCKEASIKRIEKIIKQNSMSDCMVFYNAKRVYLNYFEISGKTQSYSSLEDLADKVKYFKKINNKRDVCIIIHEGVSEYGCFPEISFENSKIVTPLNKEIKIFPIVNLAGGEYLWSNGYKEEVLNLTPTKNTSLSVRYNLNGCLSDEAKIDVLISDCIDRINFRFDLKNKLMYEEYRGTYFIYPPNKELDRDFISKRLSEDPNYYLIIDSICTASDIKVELFSMQNSLIKTLRTNLFELNNSRDIPKLNGKTIIRIPSTIFNETPVNSGDLEYSKEYKLKLTVLDNKGNTIDYSNFVKVLFVKCPYYDED